MSGHGKATDYWTLGIFIYECLCGCATGSQRHPLQRTTLRTGLGCPVLQHDLSTKANTHRHETCTVRGSRRNSLSTRAACCAVPCCTGPRPSQPATTSPHMTLSSRTLLFVSLAHLTYWFCSSLSTCLHQGQGHCKRATPVRLSRSVPFRSVPFRSVPLLF